MITDSRLAGILSRKHFFSLPLDYQHPTGEQLQIFARELIGTQDNAATLPLLVFFQGGPGFGAARPLANGGWIKRALRSIGYSCWISVVLVFQARSASRHWTA